MKKILILMVATATLGSCKKEELPVPAVQTETYQHIRVTVEMSSNHTLVNSYYELRAITSDGSISSWGRKNIPIYATTWENTQMCKDSSVVHLLLKVDNVSSPSHATTKIYWDGNLDTTLVSEFNSQNWQSGIDILYLVNGPNGSAWSE